MPSARHSAKVLETIRLMGCTATGWSVPEIRWTKERRCVPTKVRCTTCRGMGQVTEEGKRVRCSDCPRRMNWPNHGTGERVQLVEREVEVGHIEWPAGTQFDARFGGDGRHCAFCNKRITSPMSWRPVVGIDAAGTPHGMWVGIDCARTLFAVDARGIGMDQADAEAIAKGADARAARMWREVQAVTEPKAPKPVKPTLPPLPPKHELDAVVRAAFGAQLESSSFDVTRAQARYYFMLRRTPGATGMGWEATVTLRGGATVKCVSWPCHGKQLVKAKESMDLLGALTEALPAVRADLLGGD